MVSSNNGRDSSVQPRFQGFYKLPTRLRDSLNHERQASHPSQSHLTSPQSYYKDRTRIVKMIIKKYLKVFTWDLATTLRRYTLVMRRVRDLTAHSYNLESLEVKAPQLHWLNGEAV
eukprot:TRINITY_DN13962_c0_g1_i1.p1 TRINITY_DN13962_c0_g1~~TRINITY_DN13962_c0_g1_i1.p1  ORF type:complete len:116 (+),score=0.25 TRINITY_DN13962_c0_g1_i1:50-397(+)